ncbi:MAG: zinc-binding dehydrogenase [Chloroflexi bacterium]|nr:zinc-binding dehydrogenase [Chloroflexota bacterium]
MTARKTLYFTAPKQVEIREETLPVPGADEILVETICSAVSAGTEMLIYNRRFPRDLETDSVISSLRGCFEYPLAYGYACAGKVLEAGKAVDPEWKNKLVFSFQPHTSHFISKPDLLFPIPQSLSPESACFFANTETAVNLVQDAAPILGERVVVFGQGVIGLLTAALLKEFPLESLVTVDCYELRCKMSAEIGATKSLIPDSLDFENMIASQNKFDLTFELSGRPETLNDALSVTAYSGRVVIGSWYGEKRAPIKLGGDFHRSRIKLISSQVSTIAPELSGRWDKRRRFDVVWQALQRIKPEKWITHRFSLDHAVEAYHLLDENPEDAIQVILEYKP